MSRLCWIGLIGFLVGCGSEHGLYSNSQTDVWVQPDVSAVDILFVVDDSHSMGEEQEALADGFRDFIGLIDAAAVDFHLGVVTTNDDDEGLLIGSPPYLTPDDDYVRAFQQRVHVGTGGSDKEKGLQTALEALAPSRQPSSNIGFVRDEAQLLTIFVSDEDDCSDFGALDGLPSEDCYYRSDELASTTQLTSTLRAIKPTPGQFVAAGILGLSSSSCDAAWPGTRYLDVVRGTGGLVGDICERNWSDILFELGLNTVGEQYRFRTSELARASSLSVSVDGDGVASDEIDGWTYEEDEQMVVFHGRAIPPRGATVVADYIVLPSSTE